jgi:hypothetical protein
MPGASVVRSPGHHAQERRPMIRRLLVVLTLLV